MGTMVDRYGSRPILTINFLIKTAALVLLVFARSELAFIVFATIFGFGYGGAAVAHTPMIADLFGLVALSSILAGISLIGTTGAASGPVVAGWIFDVTGVYFWAFLSCIVLSLAGFIMALFLRPVEERPKKEA
jgi:MFS family permease